MSTARSALNHSSRAEAFARYSKADSSNPLDLLIVGGGVNGAGAAFDAATRGLDVALVEKSDWAQGTSSRSSKLMHGGLRYLQMLDFALVAEALRERDLLLTHTAPHLVKPISFVFPMKNILDRGFIGSGIALYDAMQIGHRAVPMHRHLFPKKLASHFPGLDEDSNQGAIEYYDAQMDDARFVTMLVRSALNLGASATNYTKVVDYLKDGSRVIGARIEDVLTGHTYDVHAKHTILAGGVWTGQQQDLAGADSGLKVLASKGVHITVPRDAISADEATGVITQTEKSVLFIIPWDEYWIVGTTDTDWAQDIEAPVATGADIDYVLEHANAVLKRPLSRDDVLGTFAGLRPLLQPLKKTEGASAKVSREHTVMEVAPGMSAIAGGKYTTYRVMAEDVVNFALGSRAADNPTHTKEIPVIGGAGYQEMRVRAKRWAAEHGFDDARVERLLFRYGSLLDDLCALIEENPRLAEPIEGAPRYIGAEIVYAARAEGAVHLADVLMRRTRLEYEVKDRGLDAAEAIAALMGEELGWDDARRTQEIEAYRSYIEAARKAEATHDDQAAGKILEGVSAIPQLV